MPLHVSSTWCSKHVEAWNKTYCKTKILCIKLVNYWDKIYRVTSQHSCSWTFLNLWLNWYQIVTFYGVFVDFAYNIMVMNCSFLFANKYLIMASIRNGSSPCMMCGAAHSTSYISSRLHYNYAYIKIYNLLNYRNFRSMLRSLEFRQCSCLNHKKAFSKCRQPWPNLYFNSRVCLQGPENYCRSRGLQVINSWYLGTEIRNKWIVLCNFSCEFHLN